MLIRIQGGHDGIRPYLIYGEMQGRTKTRDELDERVPIVGDLDIADSIIQRMTNSADRYLHITFGFKENHVSPEVIKSIVADFEEFAFSAFTKEEYYLYAEAHLPRITSYVDKKGRLVERMPHLHFVVPKKNLLGGKILDPFGKTLNNIRYLEAFQETVNRKYGLASPLDNRRVQFNVASEIVGRLKPEPDKFRESAHDVKRAILSEVLKRDVVNYKKLGALLEKFGSVRMRNAGKPTEYLNVKRPEDAKGINLKDYVFSKDFIGLSKAEKIRALEKDADFGELLEYVEPGITTLPRAVDVAALSEWHSLRAREIKYLHARDYGPHVGLTGAERAAALEPIIDRKQQAFYQRYKPQTGGDNERESGFSGVESGPARGRAKPGRCSPGHNPQQHAKRIGTLQAARSVHDLRDLSGRSLARDSERVEVFLPSNARRNVDERGALGSDKLRRPQPLESARLIVNQLTYFGREHENRKFARQHRALIDAFERAVDGYDAAEVLARSHGLLPDKHLFSRSPDGRALVFCASQTVPLSQFLRERQHLPWPQCLAVLRQAAFPNAIEGIEGAADAPLAAPGQAWQAVQVLGFAGTNLAPDEPGVTVFVNGAGRPVFELQPKRVLIAGAAAEQAREVLAAALLLARDTFGEPLRLEGSDDFRASAADLARDLGIHVEGAPPAHWQRERGG